MNLGQLIVSILTTNNFSYWYLFFILLLAIITLTICYSIKTQNQYITNCLKIITLLQIVLIFLILVATNRNTAAINWTIKLVIFCFP